MANYEEDPAPIIPEFPSDDDSSSSDESKGFEFLASVALEALEKDTASSSGTRRSIWRDRDTARDKLTNMYFVERPMFPDEVFRSRYRMSKSLFLKIVDDVTARFPWFRDGVNAAGQRSFSPIQKITYALRQLSTGNIADTYDEGLAFSSRTARECCDFFCDVVVQIYGAEHLRTPTSHDIARLYEAHEAKHHFPGMIGSIDCTHWTWRNCPMSLRGQYHRGDHEHPTIILEVVASNDLWFWHAYFGVAGSNNDINVLKQSPLFIPEVSEKALEYGFVVNATDTVEDTIWGMVFTPHGLVFLRRMHIQLSIRRRC
jgi:hypothetical protein